MKRKKSKKTGTARMRELGRASVIVWLDPAQAEQLDRARGVFRRAAWAKQMILHAIRQVLQYEKAR